MSNISVQLSARMLGHPISPKLRMIHGKRSLKLFSCALLATTFGTFLAIPLSFIAARNLMKPVKSPLASIALSILGWPIGIGLGYLVVRWVEGLSAPFTENIPVEFDLHHSGSHSCLVGTPLGFAPGGNIQTQHILTA